MVATVVLGILIAAALAYALRKMYRSYFKGEAACCDSGSCSSCDGGCAMKNALDQSYRDRVEKIEKFPIHRTIDVDGMTCDKCIVNVIRALEKIDGVTIAAASLEKQSAQVGMKENISDDILRDAIKRAGYTAGAITA